VSSSEHDQTHNKFRKWAECAREGVIGLVYQLFTVPMENDIEETYVWKSEAQANTAVGGN